MPALVEQLPVPRPGVAVLKDGVVWADGRHVLYQGFGSPSKLIGVLETSEAPVMASSADAVAWSGRGGREPIVGGLPPGRLRPIRQIGEEVSGGGCSGWSPLFPDPSTLRQFVLAGATIIDAGVCADTQVEGESAATAQPVFVRDVRGGEWRVLHWLKGPEPPVLAAEGNLAAVGVPAPAPQGGVTGRRMLVTVMDLPSGHLVGQFPAPYGTLGFASRQRLVLSFPLPRDGAQTGSGLRRTPTKPRVQRPSPPYEVELYSLTGRRVADLGLASRPPLVSHMHLLSEEGVEGDTVLSVRPIPRGPSRRLIAFNGPARRLEGIAFRWPAAAVVETTSTPLAQSEVTCNSGEYHRPSAPFLAVFDLARPEPFVPAPPSAHLAPPPATCPSWKSVPPVAGAPPRRTRRAAR